MAASVRNHEEILRTAISSKQITTGCAESLSLILDLPMTNMDKLQCELYVYYRVRGSNTELRWDMDDSLAKRVSLN